MTDSRLRSAERRAASGSVEDESRVLTERLRAGTLTRERVELAAYVGHEAARAATGMVGSHDETDAEALGHWIRAMPRPDNFVGVRVGLAACLATWHALVPTHAHQRPLHMRWTPHPYRAGVVGCEQCDGLDGPRVAMACVQAFLACPCEWHEEAAVAAGQSLGENLRWWGMLAVSVGRLRGSEKDPPSGARTARLCVEALRVSSAERLIRAAIARDLAAWALGGGA